MEFFWNEFHKLILESKNIWHFNNANFPFGINKYILGNKYVNGIQLYNVKLWESSSWNLKYSIKAHFIHELKNSLMAVNLFFYYQ